MCWVQYGRAFYYFLPKTLKSKQFAKYKFAVYSIMIFYGEKQNFVCSHL